ncbi:VanZ family protein [Cryobacterium shii]|uniref:VanZ family protein n=1 Tax=Cryobacterium shii TaxID=1259235 RepID=A0AAQ2C783_9MICO|nr:VanZ family protein [Cryobacterium shii]TFC48921.1 VanZ family protein [Cryobacterium shii]
MSDVLGVLTHLPAAAGAAAIIYGLVYFGLRRLRPRPRLHVLVAEYALVAWASLFLFVTQFMQFGNGLGKLFNLIPLRSFYIAWNYGIENAESLAQVGLNVVITAPLGFLLPVVSSRRFHRFTPILLVGLALTVATELSQMTTGRSADIDDVLANSVGVVVGYSLNVLVQAAAGYRRRHATHPTLAVRQRPERLIAAISTLALACAPFIAVVAKNNLDPVGHVYYGQILPTEVDTSGPVSPDGGESAIYRNVQLESTTALLARLRGYTGSSDSCSFADETWTCATGTSKRLFVDAFNRWSIAYDYGDSRAPNVDLIPEEPLAVDHAHVALRALHVDPDTLAYVGLADGWGDPYRHLVFRQRVQTKGQMVWGNVTVTIGANGSVVEVSDRRTYNALYERVSTISPQASLRIAAEVGLDGGPGTAEISDLQASFWFNEDTGYLIPTWQVSAEYTSGGGQTLDWESNIDARR